MTQCAPVVAMVVGRFKIEVALGCVCAETVVNVSKHVSLSTYKYTGGSVVEEAYFPFSRA